MVIKTIIFGIIEGITEWLPISSTGHMILANEFIKLDVTEDFMNVFEVVIQLGAILAAFFLFFKDIFPWGFNKTKKEKRETWFLLFKMAVACIPCIIVGLLLDDYIEQHFYNPFTVAATLIIYGILFIIIEKKEPKTNVDEVNDLTFKDSFKIGLYQALAVIPGTSRSGATIVGGLTSGLSREVITKFTFLLGIPVMFGASILKIYKFGLNFTTSEIIILLIGMSSAFVVSIGIITGLLKYIRKHNFVIFGYYRIILGIIVLLYFLVK